MSGKKVYVIAPLLVFLAFIIDTQISTLLVNLLPTKVMVTSLTVLILGIYLSIVLRPGYAIFLYAVLGSVYDIYYFDILGIAVTLLPLMMYLVYYFYQNMSFNAGTNQLLLLVIGFSFVFVSFLLARLFGLTNLSGMIFIFYQLVPTLLFNHLLLLALHPLLKKIF